MSANLEIKPTISLHVSFLFFLTHVNVLSYTHDVKSISILWSKLSLFIMRLICGSVVFFLRMNELAMYEGQS